jgi:motility quorum-sensing regulator / GCU-specific mRNA interferase toxin
MVFAVMKNVMKKLVIDPLLGYYCMEKRTPQCNLAIVKRLILEKKVRLTASASRGGRELGLDDAGIISVVANLNAKDFYKSMTTHADYTVWQDVYRPTTQVGDVYVKLTVLDDVLIVSFKEL